MTRRKNILAGIFLTLICLLIVGVNVRVNRTPLLAEDNVDFVKATVTKVTGESGQPQKVEAVITSGEHKGDTCQADNSNGYLYGADCKVGTKIIIQLSEYDGTLSGNVYGYDREIVLYVLIGIFMLVLCLIGGWQGVRSAVALVFTFVCIIFLYIPMMYMGASPFWSAVLVVFLTTVVSLYLIGGFTKKTFCAIAGSMAGVLIAGITASLFGKIGHISGYNVQDVESMIYVAQNSKLQVSGVLFSGILIASLGAVMDVSMSVSSTMSELHEKNPDMGRKELFRSGITVGKDMMGTMSNTLILAFTGGSVNTLIMLYSYNLPYQQMINMYSLGIEILQGISGTLGVILTVPFVSLIAAFVIGNKSVDEC